MRPWATSQVQSVGPDGAAPDIRRLAEEVPVALCYDGSTHAVMLASPADLDDFALGFSLSEGIVERPDQIARIERADHDEGIELRIWLAPGLGARLAGRRRSMVGPVGCGLCGVESLAAATRPLPVLPPGGLSLTPPEIAEAMTALGLGQELHGATRAAHAAGFWTRSEGLVALCEDVGRHNALDKLVGRLARLGRDASGGAILLTSRVSIELVQKAVLARAPALIAVSAPTLRAVAAAEAAGLTLVARARGQSLDIHSHARRIAAAEIPHDP
ncbi:formate dehydrogenase accessory sulfurtransferase FdhD [Rhodovulum sulfidophilum]|uniref:formate dehydrogenase accessory sulfurtransferase FdhD n=1 Tax=Rhodovulum sulfidophilum TaxID=35806 RepID=UPI001927C580|nr:formate dehydrogenase accessory sulfurtransferase FdhD [Rhodovulum sulfidophilum]MBL3585601.1 formate dehydrogenase accessory sulfurtransferase FdhD [Rhodovulum sulfidophilum]